MSGLLRFLRVCPSPGARWAGTGANRREKAKGMDMVTRIRNDRGALPGVKLLWEEDRDEDLERCPGLWVHTLWRMAPSAKTW